MQALLNQGYHRRSLQIRSYKKNEDHLEYRCCVTNVHDEQNKQIVTNWNQRIENKMIIYSYFSFIFKYFCWFK